MLLEGVLFVFTQGRHISYMLLMSDMVEQSISCTYFVIIMLICFIEYRNVCGCMRLNSEIIYRAC